MELKELTDKTLELFGVTSPEQLGAALLAACGDPDKLRTFRELVGGDLSVDWMQKIYHFDEGRKLEYRKTKWGILLPMFSI